MSYYKVKSIAIKKTGEIYVTAAANNITPLDYDRQEFRGGLKNLFMEISFGHFQLQKSAYKYLYAMNKVYEKFPKFSDLTTPIYKKREEFLDTSSWEQADKETLENFKLFDEGFQVFRQALNERVSSEKKYYLYSESLGYLQMKGKGQLGYSDSPLYAKKQEYRQMYNHLSTLSPEFREKYKISIREN